MARLQEDMRRLRFWRSLIGEFLGSMFVVLIGCGTWTQGDDPEHPDAVKIALAFGLTYMAVLFCIRSVSDGHVNPAVTLAFLATRKTSVIRSLLYLVCQLLGALLGAAFVFAITSAEYRHKYPHAIGCTVLAEHVAESHGFGVEFFATFFFVFVVYACYEKKSSPESIGDAAIPFIIGLTYTAVSLFAIPYTGGSMNPARSFGPALVTGIWADHWIYWFGPILGGVTGGATYDLVFSTKSSFKRLRACFLVFHRSDDPETQQPKTGGGDETDEEAKEVVVMTDAGLESAEDLNAKAENSGNEDHRPSRSKLFRPKFPCCQKEGH